MYLHDTGFRLTVRLYSGGQVFLPLFISYSDLFLPTHCRCRRLLLHLITLKKHTHTPTHEHSVVLLWTRDRPFAEIST